MDKVCTVIVTYNGVPWIEKCLEHLLASTYPTDIIVVDNHSTDHTLSLLEPYLAKISLIKSPQNLGFGGGNNLGIKSALLKNAPFIFLLNQDAYVEPGCIGSLVSALKQHPHFGIMSPLQLNSDGTRLDKAFKKYMLPFISAENLDKINSTRLHAADDPPLALRFVNAAAWMIKREAILKTGFFHPVFIHYGEDNHYASRMQYHGYKIGVSCNAAMIHDRHEEEQGDEKILARKLKTVPLYTLLDIRKALPVALLLGLLKLYSTGKKLKAIDIRSWNEVYPEQKKWFTVRLKEAVRIRKETKRIATHH